MSSFISGSILDDGGYTDQNFLELKLNSFKLKALLQTHSIVTLARIFLGFHVDEH